MKNLPVILCLPGLKETTNILDAMGGEYKEYIVDISKKEEVYKVADQIRQTMGDVSCSLDARWVHLFVARASATSVRAFLKSM